MANINNAVVSERSKNVLSEKIPKRGTPIYVELYRKMLQLIKEGEFAYGDMLPGEEYLAELTGTGRSSVRSALMLLCEDGYTETRRGRGTFVTYKGDTGGRDAEIPDRYILPKERVRAQFGDVKVFYSSSRRNTYDEFLDGELRARGQGINIFIRAYGSEEPAVVSFVYFREELFTIDGLTDDEIDDKLDEVFRDRVATVDTVISPAYSTEMHVAGFGRDMPSKRYLLTAAVWYDREETPLAYCKDYYNSDVLRFRQRFRKE